MSVDDPKIIIVSLTAIDNILRIGEQIVKEAAHQAILRLGIGRRRRWIDKYGNDGGRRRQRVSEDC